MLALALLGGCRYDALPQHCANNNGDQTCRASNRGQFCSPCVLDNDGCVERQPSDPSCRAPTLAGETADGDTQSPGAESTASDGGGTSTDPGSCSADGSACVPQAPDGFEGPVLWLEHEIPGAPLDCAPPYDTLSLEAFNDLLAPPATCGCDCGPLTSGACGSGTMHYYDGPGCAGTPADTLLLLEGCNSTGGTGWPISGDYEYLPPVVVAGSCEETPTETLPEALFQTRHLGCSAPLAQLDCNDTQLCAITPDTATPGRWCVWQEGDHGCPPGAYTDPLLAYRAHDDNRGCEPCACTIPDVSCETASAQLSTLDDCRGISAGNVPPDGCADGSGSDPVLSVSRGPASPPDAQCLPNRPQPTGDATATQPVTVCCLAQ